MLREKGVCGRVFCFKFNGTIFRQNNDAAKEIANISLLPLTAVTKNKNSFSICFGFRGANKGLFALLALHKYGHLPQTSAVIIGCFYKNQKAMHALPVDCIIQDCIGSSPTISSPSVIPIPTPIPIPSRSSSG